MPLRAIGLLHLGYPDQLPAARATIEALARKHDYTVVRFLRLDFDTFMPTTCIIDAAAEARAAVVIAADLDHFGTAYRAVPRACPVLLPTGLIPGPLAYTTVTTGAPGEHDPACRRR
ncbi:hypothetical protein ACWEKT_07465 [Nocardia takedensis]